MIRSSKPASPRAGAANRALPILIGLALAVGICLAFTIHSRVRADLFPSVEAADQPDDARFVDPEAGSARGERRRQLIEIRRVISELQLQLDSVERELQRIRLSRQLTNERLSLEPRLQETLRRLQVRRVSLETEAARIRRDLLTFRRLEGRHLEALDQSLRVYRQDRDHQLEVRIDAEMLEVLDPDPLGAISHLLQGQGGVVQSGAAEETMTHSLNDIEGIQPRVLNLLKRHWIDTAEQLLAAGARPGGVRQLARTVGSSEEEVRELLQRSRDALPPGAVREMEARPKVDRPTGLLIDPPEEDPDEGR